MSEKALLLFQLGPVQEFIAQAVTLGNLKAGSELLSEVTNAAVQEAVNFGAELMFPNLETNKEAKGIPNRFLAEVPCEKAETIAETCCAAAQDRLKKIVQSVPVPEEKREAFNQQVERFLQITWAVLKQRSGKMKEDYEKIGRLMALRRNARTFEQWHEEGDGQAKDFLSGKEVALEKGLGAMNLIKCHRSEDIDIPKDWKDYLAVIALDGDSMGARLSGFESKEKHLEFSGKLTAFAKSVPENMPKNGLLIYAGGDDVLAVVPLKEAIETAEKLQERFTDIVGGTASAGIAIGHCSVPLQALVQAAHTAESRAKQGYARNALAVSVFKRSGEILEWGCKWNSQALEIYKKLTEISKDNSVKMKRFPYKLAALIAPYAFEKSISEEMQKVVMAEFDHAIEQTEGIQTWVNGKGVSKVPREKVEAYLQECAKEHAADFLNLFLMETFINRPPKEEKKDGE